MRGLEMKKTLLAIALFLLAGSALAQSAAPASTMTAADPLQEIVFSWDKGTQTQTGFQKAPQEVSRYDTLTITVPPSFATDAGKQLAAAMPASPIVDELNAFTQVAAALKTYTDAIAAAAAASPGKDISLDPGVVAARTPLAQALLNFIKVVKAADPALYDTVKISILKGYPGLATALQQGIDQVRSKIEAQARDTGGLALTASLVPVESDARPLHLPGYDQIAQSAVAAIPNYIPVVDSRTQAEVKAAQTLIDTAKQLSQVGPEFQKTMQQFQQALDKLKTDLKTNVLEAQLTQLEQDIKKSAATDLGPLLTEVQTAKTLVHNLNSANLTLSGTSDADKLLGLAGTVSDTANGLVSAAANLPSDLQKLSTDLEAAVKKHVQLAAQETVSTIKTAAQGFLDEQVFFKALAGNIKLIVDQFSANDDAALSAERLEAAIQPLTGTANLSTSLDVSMIAGDVEVQDRIVVQAALYRRNSDNTLTALDQSQQSFIVQRYGIFPDSVRGALLFVQPRSKIDRDLSYQPVPALGYYWRYGRKNHPVWNSAGPSLGFTMALLDFSDKSDLEIGFAAGVSILKDLLWTGYGRNLQARANYFYVGLNPLLLAKMIGNRTMFR
jgi:hypothetical protein